MLWGILGRNTYYFDVFTNQLGVIKSIRYWTHFQYRLIDQWLRGISPYYDNRWRVKSSQKFSKWFEKTSILFWDQRLVIYQITYSEEKIFNIKGVDMIDLLIVVTKGCWLIKAIYLLSVSILIIIVNHLCIPIGTKLICQISTIKWQVSNFQNKNIKKQNKFQSRLVV